MLYRKIIGCRFNVTDFDIRRDLKTNYRDKMAVKYHFSSQAVAWSGILRNGIGLIIRFREPTRIKLNEDEFFEVINVCFYYDSIMYMVTPGGKMHHVNEGKVYATTMMNGKMTPE